VLDRPQPPVNVTIRCQATTVDIDWWPGSDGNDEITGYTVYYRSLAAGPASYDIAVANTTSAVLPVKPWLNYTFTVQARNKIGRSDGSDLVHCTTVQTAPFDHPRNVCTQSRLSNHLVIVWQVTNKHVVYVNK